jgi:hypothetical protein
MVSGPRSVEYAGMGLVWGLIKGMALFFAVIIAALVLIDGSLLANVLGKAKD